MPKAHPPAERGGAQKARGEKSQGPAKLDAARVSSKPSDRGQPSARSTSSTLRPSPTHKKAASVSAPSTPMHKREGARTKEVSSAQIETGKAAKQGRRDSSRARSVSRKAKERKGKTDAEGWEGEKQGTGLTVSASEGTRSLFECAGEERSAETAACARGGRDQELKRGHSSDVNRTLAVYVPQPRASPAENSGQSALAAELERARAEVASLKALVTEVSAGKIPLAVPVDLFYQLSLAYLSSNEKVPSQVKPRRHKREGAENGRERESVGKQTHRASSGERTAGRQRSEHAGETKAGEKRAAPAAHAAVSVLPSAPLPVDVGEVEQRIRIDVEGEEPMVWKDVYRLRQGAYPEHLSSSFSGSSPGFARPEKRGCGGESAGPSPRFSEGAESAGSHAGAAAGARTLESGRSREQRALRSPREGGFSLFLPDTVNAAMGQPYRRFQSCTRENRGIWPQAVIAKNFQQVTATVMEQTFQLENQAAVVEGLQESLGRLEVLLAEAKSECVADAAVKSQGEEKHGQESGEALKEASEAAEPDVLPPGVLHYVIIEDLGSAGPSTARDLAGETDADTESGAEKKRAAKRAVSPSVISEHSSSGEEGRRQAGTDRLGARPKALENSKERESGWAGRSSLRKKREVDGDYQVGGRDDESDPESIYVRRQETANTIACMAIEDGLQTPLSSARKRQPQATPEKEASTGRSVEPEISSQSDAMRHLQQFCEQATRRSATGSLASPARASERTSVPDWPVSASKKTACGSESRRSVCSVTFTSEGPGLEKQAETAGAEAAVEASPASGTQPSPKVASPSTRAKNSEGKEVSSARRSLLSPRPQPRAEVEKESKPKKTKPSQEPRAGVTHAASAKATKSAPQEKLQSASRANASDGGVSEDATHRSSGSQQSLWGAGRHMHAPRSCRSDTSNSLGAADSAGAAGRPESQLPSPAMFYQMPAMFPEGPVLVPSLYYAYDIAGRNVVFAPHGVLAPAPSGDNEFQAVPGAGSTTPSSQNEVDSRGRSRGTSFASQRPALWMPTAPSAGLDNGVAAGSPTGVYRAPVDFPVKLASRCSLPASPHLWRGPERESPLSATVPLVATGTWRHAEAPGGDLLVTQPVPREPRNTVSFCDVVCCRPTEARQLDGVQGGPAVARSRSQISRRDSAALSSASARAASCFFSRCLECGGDAPQSAAPSEAGGVTRRDTSLWTDRKPYGQQEGDGESSGRSLFRKQESVDAVRRLRSNATGDLHSDTKKGEAKKTSAREGQSRDKSSGLTVPQHNAPPVYETASPRTTAKLNDAKRAACMSREPDQKVASLLEHYTRAGRLVLS
ncbi:conserved hypothetical protein [Neospora caninum Liverpool]|uniref:Uncharacterized protein n=1 Tax=Neospora caninum (strain Liverpool) TaxID=572307 RepID=F0VR63_NEOCL|nr:conserved hypothetical protein [Neospora caninum Liverpool]CBZ56211.1 conserved hypothetical protein [Neospora caninum Liverpool]CEL70973.1 TPA: hypothetical protein BN1204_066360 [Neospora caninum Liverpool]|eukprot:XP_003886236.1 conserved hypothetical protein [Neospora caninum Liverpool]